MSDRSNRQLMVGVVRPLGCRSDSDQSEEVENQTLQDDVIAKAWSSRRANIENESNTQKLLMAKSHQAATGQATRISETMLSDTTRDDENDSNTKNGTTKKNKKSRRKILRGLCCVGWILFCPLCSLYRCLIESPDYNDHEDVYGDLTLTPYVIASACCGLQQGDEVKDDRSIPAEN